MDHDKVRADLEPLLRCAGNTLIEVDTGHPVQFEQPEALAESVLDFIENVQRLREQPASVQES